MDAIGFAADGTEEQEEHTEDGEAAAAMGAGSTADAGGAEVASLAVTRADQGGIEFELDGKVYRVLDTAAFAEAVAAGPKPPRRSLAALRRAQRADREARREVAEAQAEVAAAKADAKADEPQASPRHGSQREAVARALQAASAPLDAQLATLNAEASTRSAWGGPSLAEEMQQDSVASAAVTG